jgi:uncharacterized membrane protein
MEAGVEARLKALEERVARVEGLLQSVLAQQPAQMWPPPPQRALAAQPAPAQAPAPARPPRREVDLEELLGGRVLGWAGGIAVVLGVVFFLCMAVRRGWIDEPTRVVLAFLGSTALLGLSFWLHERHGRTQASLAACAAAIASLYASLTVGTLVYDLIPGTAGFGVAALIGAVATAIAVRWDSRVVAGIGIVGALLAPVLVDAGTSSASLGFMALALVSAVGVLLWRSWDWLAAAAFLVSVFQLLAWVDDHRTTHLGLTLGVLTGFWALYVVAALGYELRAPTETLRSSSALLLLANVLAVAGAGWLVLDDQGHGTAATAWVLGFALGHVALGAATLRGRISREIGSLLIAIGLALSAIGFGLALSGPALVIGWAVHAAVLLWIARRTGDERAALGGGGFLAAALGHVLLFEAPLRSLVNGSDDLPNAVVGVAAVAGASLGGAWLRRDREDASAQALEVLGAALVLYGFSVAIVDAFGGGQSGQLTLSAFWAATGLAALVAGLATDVQRLRLAGFALLGIAVVKVFLFDLARLESVYRVGSFVALGLLLLAGAFAYQRARAAE